MDFKTLNIVTFATEELASFRLRQKVIAEYLNSNSKEWRVFISDTPDFNADVNLFHKHINHTAILQWVKLLRGGSKSKIIFDVTDFWFEDKTFGPFYQEMCTLADLVTTSSFELADYTKQFNEWVTTIHEPTQLGWVTDEIRAKPREKKYVWLGHKNNLSHLLPHIDKYGKDLTIISNINVPGVECIPWYEGAEELLLQYETVLLPQEDKYKSPNRLVDAKLAGCKVLTFNAPCYSLFEDADLNYFKVMFTLEAIALKWEYQLNQMLTRSRTVESANENPRPLHPALEGKKYVKLNVGCGNKIYPKKEGWVNIDLVPFPDLDIKHDVRKIHEILGSNVADELHAYHVCEHIYPQELRVVLRGWFDVIKPGGKIVIEMPDFLKAAKNILQFETTEDKALWFDLGLKAFYGEYDSSNPNVVLDLHKWLWTFKTFKPELVNVGFVDIEEHTPGTHRKERDFRIVGYKPYPNTQL